MYEYLQLTAPSFYLCILKNKWLRQLRKKHSITLHKLSLGKILSALVCHKYEVNIFSSLSAVLLSGNLNTSLGLWMKIQNFYMSLTYPNIIIKNSSLENKKKVVDRLTWKNFLAKHDFLIYFIFFP